MFSGEKVDLSLIPTHGGGTLTTDKGTQIEADLFFKCIGLWTNNEAYKDSLGETFVYLSEQLSIRSCMVYIYQQKKCFNPKIKNVLTLIPLK